MESIIKQKIDLIAECIFTKIQETQSESFGLYSGEFGILLFLFYYSKYSKNKKHTLLTENYAEKLLEQFIEREKLHTFSDGLSGILYLFEFLRENDFIDMDVSGIQSLLDNYIVTRMRQDIIQRKYDFMHGALGVGLYLLKKGAHPEYIQELIDFLYDTAEKDTDEQIFKWESVIDPEKNLIGYNLALSHGISSIIIFLSRVVKSGMIDEKIIEMLSGAVNYVLSQQMDFLQFGSYFPSYLPINSSKSVSKSRIAWCYGDLGIGVALWQTGKVLEKSEWKDKGLEILLQSTKRRNYNESFVVDAGICHGSAGIAMIYRRMYLETGRDEFKDAIQYWINQTLNFSRFEDSLAGYKTHLLNGWINDYSLLTGISGIGLVLMSCLFEDEQTWDEILLLS
ncbi:MAG: lanthionine synthetase C family protein [Candidatus Azobacteroides sp.]|nr:lanthionine synthetase C family protein [Candidatus Azobacteroides sp.]